MKEKEIMNQGHCIAEDLSTTIADIQQQHSTFTFKKLEEYKQPVPVLEMAAEKKIFELDIATCTLLDHGNRKVCFTEFCEAESGVRIIKEDASYLDCVFCTQRKLVSQSALLYQRSVPIRLKLA